MKPILTKEENVNLYIKNFMQLGEALMNAGGNSFVILKRYDDFLRTLAANNIEVTAKYDGPEFKKQEDCTEEKYEAVPYEQQEADAIEKECEEYEITKDKMIFYDEVDQKMTEEDWNSFGEYHNKPEPKEKEDVKPNTLEIYPPDSEKGKSVYFLEIYNGERWKLCLRNRIDNFSVPKIGWFGEGHPYTLGEGKIASEGLINMYTLSNLKRIVDGLNMLDNTDRSSLPSTTFETSKEKVDWQKDFPHSITTSP